MSLKDLVHAAKTYVGGISEPLQPVTLLHVVTYHDGTHSEFPVVVEHTHEAIEAECHRMADEHDVAEIIVYQKIFHHQKTRITETTAAVGALGIGVGAMFPTLKTV